MPSLASSARAAWAMCFKSDLRSGSRGDERRAQRDLADLAAGKVESARELAEVRVVKLVRFSGRHWRQICSRASRRPWKVDDEAKAAQERGIEVLAACSS